MELPPDIQLMGVLQDDRLVLESLRQKFDGPGVEQTAGTLIFTQSLPVGTGGTVELINFPVIQDQNQFDNEIRLDRTDSFTCMEVGMFLGYATTSALAARQAPDIMLTGPNPTSVAAGVGITDPLFWAFQRAQLIMKADTVTYIETFDMVRTRRVGVAQQGLDAGGGVLYSADQWGKDYGMARLVPSFTLSGAFKNSVQLKLPRPTSTAGIADTLTATVSLMFRGFFNQGGAEFKTAKV